MQWTVAHRADADAETQHASIEAETPADAMEQLRGQLPAGATLLYVMRQE